MKNKLQSNVDKKNDLRKLRVNGFLDGALYNQELMRVEKENEEIRAALQNFDKSGEHRGIKETEKLLHFIETTEMLTEFRDEMFSDFVENIYVYTRTCIGFRLKCGLTLKEEVCTGTK